MAGLPLDSLPPAWREAFAREQLSGKPLLADPLPERRVARLLAAFITTGLVFLVLPGTLLGVWNLLTISAGRQADATSTAWIQAHGHAQLFGWVTSFMLGICLYAFPKFRGRSLRSLAVGWLMFAMLDHRRSQPLVLSGSILALATPVAHERRAGVSGCVSARVAINGIRNISP
jgi:hypothetical protein